MKFRKFFPEKCVDWFERTYIGPDAGANTGVGAGAGTGTGTGIGAGADIGAPKTGIMFSMLNDCSKPSGSSTSCTTPRFDAR